jgi:signal transduction histidine kinase
VVVDPRHLVRDVSRILVETMPRQIVVESATRDDIWGIVGDPTQLHQVLINLCVNARDAMPDGGILRVATDNVRFDEAFVGVEPEAKAGPYVTLTVSDTGYGMSPDVLVRAFEPFFTTKAVGKGTGLGLATVQAIVKSHGGWITVYSELGQGSMFRVYLPAEDVASGQERVAPVVELPRGDGELILVVDDEAAILGWSSRADAGGRSGTGR